MRKLDAKLASHLTAQSLDEWGLEFDDLATLDAGKMIVFHLGLGFKLLAMVVVSQIAWFDQSEFLEEVQGPIDRGEIDTGIAPFGAAIQLPRVEMIRALLDDVQEQCTLARDTLTASTQQAMSLAHPCLILPCHRSNHLLSLLPIIGNNILSGQGQNWVRVWSEDG